MVKMKLWIFHELGLAQELHQSNSPKSLAMHQVQIPTHCFLQKSKRLMVLPWCFHGDFINASFNWLVGFYQLLKADYY
jgi:hypothetical protein